MDDYIGTIKYFATDFAPTGWLPCDGRELEVTRFQTLYALIGNEFGGGGVTFALPNIPTKIDVRQTPAAGYCICVNGIFPQRP